MFPFTKKKPAAERVQLGLRVRALLFITAFLAVAISSTVTAMSWNARHIIIEQVERDVQLLGNVLSQSISLSQQLPDQLEDVLGLGLQSTATAISHFIAAAESGGRSPKEITTSLHKIIDNTMIAEIWVTDPKGRAYLNAPLKGVDFTFSPDPKLQPQASAFWPLLEGNASVINQLMSQREIDKVYFKYVGVPGVDKPRIVQVGTPGASLQTLKETVGVEKLTRVLVGTGALKAIHVVQTDLSPLASHSEADKIIQFISLDEVQTRLLKDAIATGQSHTRILDGHIEVFQRITDEFGKSIGGFIVELPRQGLDDLLKEQFESALIIGLLVFFIGGMVSLIFADRIAKPISRVTRVAQSVYSGDFSNLDQLKPIGKRTDEIGELSRVFHEMSLEVKNRERVLDELVTQRTHELADKNQALSQAQSLINKELDLARQLQLAILPDQFPDIAQTTGHARMLPATQMGGDFYDFIALPDGRVAMVMADVSGKGVTAAFFMAVARTSINSLVRADSDPARCLQRANDELCSQNPLDLFVTVFLAIFDPTTGRLDYCNGGHNPPLIQQADGAFHWLPLTGDMALGVMSEITYTTATIQLKEGDVLLSYTDGVTEAFNSAQEAYGEDRLQHMVQADTTRNPQALVDQLFADVAHFAAGAAQSDDITVAALSWKAAAP